MPVCGRFPAGKDFFRQKADCRFGLPKGGGERPFGKRVFAGSAEVCAISVRRTDFKLKSGQGNVILYLPEKKAAQK